MKKIIRVATMSGSFTSLLSGQLRFMSDHYEMIAVASSGGKINGEDVIDVLAKNEGVQTYTVEMTRQITPLKDFLALCKLYKLFKKEKPEIVHSHTPKAGTLAMIAAKLANVPHRLHTIAGLPLVEAQGKKRKLLNLVEKITYACATKIYPNSEGLKKFVVENNFTKPQKLKVIGNGSSNGIDTSLFDPKEYSDYENSQLREGLNIKDSDFVYVFMGRLVKDKGINELVMAFKNINKVQKNVKLLLLGIYEEELNPLLKEIQYEIENNPNILKLDWQDDVRPYLAISDVLTFPSYREGFPNTVMQACAMELPCIVSDINGCNEIIRNNINGVIIPVKNIQALEQAMKKLLTDSDFYNKLTLNTRQVIKNKYERVFVWEQILNEYDLLLSQNV